MKLLGYVLVTIGFFIILFGPEDSRYPITMRVLLASTFLVWGGGSIVYSIKHYRGGIISILGGLLTGFGIWVGYISLFFNKNENVEELIASLIATSLFLVSGLILLYQGHKNHVSSKK